MINKKIVSSLIFKMYIESCLWKYWESIFFNLLNMYWEFSNSIKSYLSLPSKSLLSGDSCTTKTKFIQTKYSIMSLAKVKYQTDKLYLLIFHFSSQIAIIFNLFLQIILFQCTIKICNSLKHYTVETK
jgi:hypothetical protein